MKKSPEYQTGCGWNALLAAPQSAQTPRAGLEADVVIVGAGYTGLAAARRWRELAPGERIVIVDASRLGEGNPGRNSGFLLEIALAHDADVDNLARMRTCNRLLQATMQGISGRVAQHAIDCNLARTGTFRAAAGKAGIAALDRYRRFLDAAGLPSQRLDRDSLAGRIGSRYYRAALYSPHCYLVQPAALIRGLAKALPEGIDLFENTPVLGVDRARGSWRLVTPHGELRAGKVVLANNAFCRHLGPGRSRIAAMYTYAALTEALPAAELDACGTDREWGLLPAHRLGSTLRRTADSRLLIRSFYGYEREAGTDQVSTLLRAALARRFPSLANVAFAAAWSGATGFTWNAAPLWGELQPGLYVSAGCNGGGVVKGTLFGEQLAELAHGGSSADIPGLFGRASWMPPEPVRRLGFELIAAFERGRARAEM